MKNKSLLSMHVAGVEECCPSVKVVCSGSSSGEDGIVPRVAQQASVSSLCQQHPLENRLETRTCDNLTSH